MDLDTPEGRLAYIEAHGHNAFDRAMQAKFAHDTIETVNGYNIRRVVSHRFGTVYMVDGTNRGHQTLEGARRIAYES